MNEAAVAARDFMHAAFDLYGIPVDHLYVFSRFHRRRL